MKNILRVIVEFISGITNGKYNEEGFTEEEIKELKAILEGAHEH